MPFSLGVRGRAQAGGGFGQADSQPVQAVRVQPRHDADGIRTGRYLRGQRLKELAAQPEVGEFQGGVLVIHPVHCVGRLAGLGAEQGTDLCLPRPHGLRGFQRAPAADDAQAHAALIVFGGQDLDLAHRTGKGGVGAAAGTDIRPGMVTIRTCPSISFFWSGRSERPAPPGWGR